MVLALNMMKAGQHKSPVTVVSSGPSTVDRPASQQLLPFFVGFFALLWSSALVVDAVATGVGSALSEAVPVAAPIASVTSTTTEASVLKDGPTAEPKNFGATSSTFSEGQSFWLTVLRAGANCFTNLFSEFLEGFIVCIVVVAVVCCLPPSSSREDITGDAQEEEAGLSGEELRSKVD